VQYQIVIPDVKPFTSLDPPWPFPTQADA